MLFARANRTPAHLARIVRPRLPRMTVAYYGRAIGHHPEGLPVWVEHWTGNEGNGGGEMLERVWKADLDTARLYIACGHNRVACPVGAIAHRYN